jgi:N-acetylglucosaminyl-diphospho-decaprenol L-rhamnosyltransferase
MIACLSAPPTLQLTARTHPLDTRADAIIVAYRSAEVIRACVQSLRNDPALNRIIVVNNSPEDGTRQALQGISGVHFFESHENVGFGRAINRVRHMVTASWVVLANPDTTQETDTISSAIEFLRDKPSAGLVGPQMFTSDGRLDRNSKHAMSLHRMIAEKLRLSERMQVSRTRSDHLHAHQSEYVIASFVVCRRSALDSVSWFDERIFLFGEDQDLCRRLRAAGWEVWYAPVGRVIHASGHSWRQLGDVGHAHFRLSRRRELRADAGPISAFLYPLFERASGRMRRKTRPGPKA